MKQFRARWITPQDRREMLGQLPDGGRSAFLVRALEDMADYDLYDVLGELGYGLNPRTSAERAEAFGYKHADWLKNSAPGDFGNSPKTGSAVRPRRNRCPGKPARL